MINAEYGSCGTYKLRFDKLEAAVVSKIAIAYSIPKNAAIVAIVNRGMDNIGKQIERADAGTTLKQVREDGG